MGNYSKHMESKHLPRSFEAAAHGREPLAASWSREGSGNPRSHLSEPVREDVVQLGNQSQNALESPSHGLASTDFSWQTSPRGSKLLSWLTKVTISSRADTCSLHSSSATGKKALVTLQALPCCSKALEFLPELLHFAVGLRHSWSN